VVESVHPKPGFNRALLTRTLHHVARHVVESVHPRDARQQAEPKQRRLVARAQVHAHKARGLHLRWLSVRIR
jgi:hypothetical protein